MIELHYNFKDLFRATRLGLSLKKIFVMLMSLITGFVLYFIIAYIAYMTSGISIADIWNTYKLFPLPVFGVTVLNWYSWLIWYLGAIIFFITFIFGQTAVSKITFEQLKGNEFYEMKEATKYSFKFWKSAFLAPVTLIILIAIMILGAFIFGLIGRIPYFGPLFLIVFLIPILFGALFTVYLMIVFFVSLFVSPVIAGTSKSDTFDTLFETFSIVWDQPWRLVIWSGLVFIMSSLGTYILGSILRYTLELTRWALSFWNGGSWLKIWANAFHFLPPVPGYAVFEKFALNITPFWLNIYNFHTGNWAINIVSVLLGLLFYVIGFTIISYFITSWTAGQTMIYVNLVKIKDDVNLLEENDEEFDELDNDFEDEEETDTEEDETEDEEETAEEDKSNTEEDN